MCVPAVAERAVRRRLRARCDTVPAPLPHRTRPARTPRPSRRLRRILRSRSDGSSTRECHKQAYIRSYSCPEYPVQCNTYKLTENEREYIFQVPILQPPVPIRIEPFSKERRTLPANIYFGPTPSYLPYKKTAHRQVVASCYDCAGSLVAGFVESQKSREARRRRLPNIQQLSCQSSQNRSLSQIQSIDRNEETYNENNSLYSKANTVLKIEGNSVQYHGYDSGGSDAESTIHISIEKQHSFEKFKSDTCKIEPTDKVKQIKENDQTPVYEYKCNRKKFLSLDLRSSHEGSESPVQSQLLDQSKTENKDNSCKQQNDNSPKQQSPINIDKRIVPKKNSSIRRYSESCVTMKSLPVTLLPTPVKTEDIFKMVSRKSISGPQTENDDEPSKKHVNVVSINEIPTFQEYRSPNSNSPQSSIDLSCKKPLPSIIKSARSRSHSVAATNHIDREFSFVANYLSIALSPPKLGSNRRALTPAASHLPLDDHHNIPDATDPAETLLGEQFTPVFDEPEIRNRRESIRKLPATPEPAPNKIDKPVTRRDSKRSNDYGGRDNGHNNNQPQPLERRESRRGQFTRSLSNADVPPDEKAGK